MQESETRKLQQCSEQIEHYKAEMSKLAKKQKELEKQVYSDTGISIRVS